MRYTVIIQLDTREFVELSESTLPGAIKLAQGLVGNDWWEVHDDYAGNIIASSDSEAKHAGDD